MKIRTKITLLFTLLVATILLLISFSVYYLTSLDRSGLSYKRLRSRATYNAQLFSILDNPTPQLDRLNTSSILQIPGLSIGIYNLQGKPQYEFAARNSIKFPLDQEIIGEVLVQGEKSLSVNHRDVLVYFSSEISKPLLVVVSGYDRDGWNRLNKLQRLLIISSFAGIGIAVLAGFLFSQQLLRPIGNMINEVNLITSQNLSTTIHAGTSKDEMSELAETFNNLLNRLQDSFIAQRRFISSASHELSTPLTSISSQLQVALQRSRSSDEYKNTIKSVHEDVQQMLSLTRSLLEIAKTGGQVIELNEIRVDELLFKVMVDVQKLSEEYSVEINFNEIPEDESMLMVFGNSDLLSIAFKNIIENGCKFSPEHHVDVDLTVGNSEVVVKIKNEGSFIDEKDQEHIFQPFYRSSTSGKVPGFGLGLALAKRIIALHRGSIELQSDAASGTMFILTLPCSNFEHPTTTHSAKQVM